MSCNVSLNIENAKNCDACLKLSFHHFIHMEFELSIFGKLRFMYKLTLDLSPRSFMILGPGHILMILT